MDKASELVIQYKQISWYVTKAIEAFYSQDIVIFKQALEGIKVYCELANYGFKSSYTLREEFISTFDLEVTKGDYVLISSKHVDRPTYIRKRIEKYNIEIAKRQGIKPPRKVIEYTFTGGRSEVLEFKQEITQENDINKIEPINTIDIKNLEQVQSKKKVKVLDGKLVEVEE